jgi:hypothetical protein
MRRYLDLLVVVLLGLAFLAWHVVTTGDLDGHPGATCHQTDRYGMDVACYDDTTGEDVTIDEYLRP